MKKIFVPMLVAAAVSACNMNNSAAKVDVAKEQQALMNTDKEWSKMAGDLGLSKTLDAHYADEIVDLSPGMPALVGKVAVDQAVAADTGKSMTNDKGLSWIPEKAEVAKSGEMGFTWGRWIFKGNMSGADTTMYGVYSTVWEKQTDGSWKAVVDQYNNTPKP